MVDKTSPKPAKSHAIEAAESLLKRLHSMIRMIQTKGIKRLADPDPLIRLHAELSEAIENHDLLAIAAIATRADHEIQKLGEVITAKTKELLDLITSEEEKK